MISILQNQKDKDGLRYYLKYHLKLSHKISEFISQSIIEGKQNHQDLKEISEALNASSFSGDLKKNILTAIKAQKKELMEKNSQELSKNKLQFLFE